MEDQGNQPPPVPPEQPAVPPAPPTQLIVPPAQLGQLPPLNWSHFKPDFAGKPDEDAEVHLLRKNDWKDTHVAQEVVKVQTFCLMLVGEARFWHESLRTIAVNWNSLQA